MVVETKRKEIEIFEHMSVRKAIVTLAIPSVISQLIVLLYNLIDTWFIGKTGDTNQVAAVTVAFPVFMLLNVVANLFGIGGGSLIARLLGKKEVEDAGVVATFILWVSGVVALVFSILILIGGNAALKLLGAEEQTLEFAYQFLFWTMVIGGVPTVLNLVLANIVRSEGKAKQASLGMVISGVLNIILDPILIFGLHMNVAGAGLATCLSNIVAMLYLFQYLIRSRKNSSIKMKLRFEVPKKCNILSILSIGTPAALQILLASFSNSVMLRLMSGYDSSAIAALGVEQKIELLPFYIVTGISTGILPFLAYNYASGKYKRMNQAVRYAISVGLSVAITFFVVYEVFAPFTVRFFINDPGTISYGALFVRLRCLALPFITVEFMLISVFQGIGSAKQAFTLSIFRKGIIDLPIMFLMNLVWPMYGLMLVQPFMEIMGSVIAVICKCFKR